MKKVCTFIMILTVLLTVTNNASALRIGNEIISEGDLKHEVRLKCGEPFSKEVIGYIDRMESGQRIRVMKIGEWIIRVSSFGTDYYYSLVFEGNTLTRIKSAGQK